LRVGDVVKLSRNFCGIGTDIPFEVLWFWQSDDEYFVMVRGKDAKGVFLSTFRVSDLEVVKKSIITNQGGSEMDQETRAEIAKLIVAYTKIALRIPDSDEVGQDKRKSLADAIISLRVHMGLSSGWSTEEEIEILREHGDTG